MILLNIYLNISLMEVVVLTETRLISVELKCRNYVER